jgi:hypothetical protein
MNKIVMGVMLAALLGGGFVGAAMMGVIQVPGLSPAKKAAAAQALYGADKTGGRPPDKQAAGDKGGTGEKSSPGQTAPGTQKPAAGGGGKPAKSAVDKAMVRSQPAKSAATTDPELGYKKAAKLWNEMSVDAIVKMVDAYKGPDLPRILARMDTSKVAKVLESLATDPKKSAQAAKLTKAIQQEASKVQPAEG